MPNEKSLRFLPAGSVVSERIATVYPELSAALKSFADFVLNEPMTVARLSINETVHASGVSVATANRFARKIGFDGYPEFRSEILRSFENVMAPVDRLKRKISEGASPEQIFRASLEEDLENLHETIRAVDDQRIQMATDKLVKAENIFLLAFDSAGALMNIFRQRLELCGCRVDQGTGGALSAVRHLSRMGKQDLVVSMAFPRYMRETIEVAKILRETGTPLLAITDGPSSPLAQHADLAIYIRAKRTIGTTSEAAILSVLEALAACVAARKPNAAVVGERFAKLAYPWFIAPK